MPDVVVIGGGVIGLLSAWRLAQAGLSVELFEKGRPGAESSAAAIGVLFPTATPQSPPEYLKLTQASLALFPALAEELRAISNVDIELRDEGLIMTALDEADEKTLEEELRIQRAASVPVRVLTARGTRDLEPALGDPVRGGLYFPMALQVDNVRLCSGLALSAARAGAKIRAGQMVTRVIHEGGRVHGVEVDHEQHSARWVVMAAGSWSGTVEGVSLPVRPAKGQALALEAPLVISHILDSPSGYLVPRLDGRLLVGATVEETGFDRRVTAEAVRELLSSAIRLMPALKEATVRECWAGLRPRSLDDLPVLGPVAGCEGLIAATGHFRNGILLAPITAQLVAGWVLGRPPEVDVERFSPNRFALISQIKML